MVTHYPAEVPELYRLALASDAIIIQVPYEPRVPIFAEDFGSRCRPRAGKYPSHASLPISLFPELCTATAQKLGIIEVCCCEHSYSAPSTRSEKAVSVATADGLEELAIADRQHWFLATELAAYRRDGTTLSRDELLYALQEKRAVLATIASARPPAEHLKLLSEDAIVLELPYEQLIKIEPLNRPDSDHIEVLAQGVRYRRK